MVTKGIKQENHVIGYALTQTSLILQSDYDRLIDKFWSPTRPN